MTYSLSEKGFIGYLPGLITVSPQALTAATACVRFSVIGFAVKLMAELCLFTGLGKRKRVMDEKELMIPLELGYVQEAERNKALAYEVLHF